MYSESTHVGSYRLLRQLGQGGMGAVYEAIQETIERRVAIKILRPEYARHPETTKRFFNEARAVNRIDHPGLVQIHEYGHLPEGTAYIVMELLKGETLAQRLYRLGGRMPTQLAIQFAWQIAAALTAAHDKEIFHRDLKPDNLMLVADPVAPSGERVKVLDFGIAKLTKESNRGAVTTDSDAVMGTPMYMSPEQCAGAGGVDAKSDVYSLGCVLYEMLGGRPPFYGCGPGQLIGKHLYHEPDSLALLAPNEPPALIELVHRLLLKDKKVRPDMADAADALGRLMSANSSDASQAARSIAPVDRDSSSSRHLAASRHITTLGQSTGQQRDPTSRWRRWLVAGAAIGILGAVLVSTGRDRALSQRSMKTTDLARDAKSANLTSALPQVLPQAERAPPPKVRWSVNTEPAGATILDEAGNVLGKTPWTDEHSARSGVLKIRLWSDGYREEILELDEASEVNQEIKLKRIPAPMPIRRKPSSFRAGSRPTSTKKTGMLYED